MPEHEQWMSYAELGERLGVSPDGARTKARRAGWRIQRSNDGKARVLVQLDELPEQPTGQQTDHATGHLTGQATGQELAGLREEVVELRSKLARAEAERDAATKIAAAKIDAQAVLVEELKKLLEDARQPWWRRWWDK